MYMILMGTRHLLVCWLLLIASLWLQGCGGQRAAPDSITIVSYNARGSFGDERIRAKKAEQIALTLQERGLENSDIILFQEIDDEEVMRELVSEHLVFQAFTAVVTAPPRDSAITQAVMSKYPISAARMHTIAHDGVAVTRGFLEVVVRIGTHDLILYNLHLKSQRGGTAATAPQRVAVLQAIARRGQSSAARHPVSPIIIAGDMNSTVWLGSSDAAVALAAYPVPPGVRYGLQVGQLSDVADLSPAEQATVFISPWQAGDWPGSYRYQGRWEQIDHFLLSPALFDGVGSEYGGFRVAYARADADGERGSLAPAASDHLPLVLTITLQ